jgi:hypothetical protein
MAGARAFKVASAIGVVAAAILAVNVNVLVARRYTRWDFTSDALYTLSEATRRTLRSLSEPVEVVVLLSRSDPLTAGVRHLLAAYGAETQRLQVRFLDPDRNPAEFSAIQQKYGILSGKAEDGRVVTDASIVIARGDRHWFITPDDMLRFDSESGRARPRLEQAVTEGIVNVLGNEKPLVCFSRGHQERSPGDASPEGLTELRDRVEKSNYTVSERDLTVTSEDALANCRLLVVASPRLAFTAAEAQNVATRIKAGMSAFLLLGPIAGEQGAMLSSGLEPVIALANAELGKNLIVETDPEARLPRALGEIFFAAPSAHAVTEGLARSASKLELRVLVSHAQSVRPLGETTKTLIATSDRAVALDNLSPLLAGNADEAVSNAERGRYVLGVARELDKPPGAQHAPRIIVVGSGNIAESRSFREAALYGNRILVENAVSWLAARPALVSVPEKAEQEIGLALTEESLGEVMRYVVIYMPLSAAILGAFVIVRRRALEKRSRRTESEKSKDEARA